MATDDGPTTRPVRRSPAVRFATPANVQWPRPAACSQHGGGPAAPVVRSGSAGQELHVADPLSLNVPPAAGTNAQS